ncbi:MAG: hypothetical protein Q4C96_07465 [Planctomycetia bacterium]|nr:hypothetical protein [Planctomycetia bacterium]
MTSRCTNILSQPNFCLKPVSVEEGIYIYTNDTAYDAFPLNIYTSRMKGFNHSGLCFLTKNPEQVNSFLEKHDLPRVHFQYLERGYYMNDLNLDIRDHDGLTNFGSRTFLSEDPFPFDVNGFRYYLSGRWPNDRLYPAVTLCRVNVKDPLTAWEKVIRFRNEFNSRYPHGFIYSPIPYQDKYTHLYNCNSLIAGILTEILEMGNRYDFMTDTPWGFGGQNAQAGHFMMNDLWKHDRTAEISQQREWMEKAPFSQQSFYYRLLHRDGWLFRWMGKIHDSEKE